MAFFLPALALGELKAGSDLASGKWKTDPMIDAYNKQIDEVTKRSNELPGESQALQLSANQAIGGAAREAKANVNNPAAANKIDLEAGARYAASQSGIAGKYASLRDKYLNHISDLQRGLSTAKEADKNRIAQTIIDPLATTGTGIATGFLQGQSWLPSGVTGEQETGGVNKSMDLIKQNTPDNFKSALPKFASSYATQPDVSKIGSFGMNQYDPNDWNNILSKLNFNKGSSWQPAAGTAGAGWGL